MYSYCILIFVFSLSCIKSEPILNPNAKTIQDNEVVKQQAAEICSCGLKIIMNGTDSFFLKSPNYTSDPCAWEFHVLPRVSVEINCFIHGIKGVQMSPSKCMPEGDSFSISVHGKTEAHCNPFHHFSKYFVGSPKEKGYTVFMNFKRHQVIEMEGQSFECSINGNFVNPLKTMKSKLTRDLIHLKEDLNLDKCGEMKLPLRGITNGEIISPEQYPWIVPLSIEGDKLCGGTILGHHWILTSAHCVAKAHWAKVYFGVREYGFYEETQISQEFVIHPEYNFPHHDLALIKLPKSIFYTRFVQPVCLPIEETEEKSYEGFGWSTISDDETGASRYLRGTVLKEIKLENCRNKYGNPKINHDIICIQSPNTCLEEKNEDLEKDFSASILGQIQDKRFIIYGIASFSSNTCNESYPIGFTRLFPHVKWIMKHMDHPSTGVQLLPTFDVLDHGF